MSQDHRILGGCQYVNSTAHNVNVTYFPNHASDHLDLRITERSDQWERGREMRLAS